MTPRLPLAAAAAALSLTGLVTAAPSSAAEHTKQDACVASVPEPGSQAPVQICYSLFKPASATATTPVPVIFHSHGWGGSRSTAISSFSAYLDQGYGVISFDQRGFGQSGGRAHVENPAYEGEDVLRLVDLVAAQDWVAKEDAAGTDPVLGAIGGSYGGGYQFVGAFTDLMKNGRNRFDALAPEITWNDLKTALAPSEVARSVWLSLLTGTSTQDVDETAVRGYAYGATTGLWPGKGDLPGTDLDAFFEKNGPAWHVAQGRTLDIPVLFGQGISDNLFNLNEAVTNFDTALTPAARAKSIFIGYNGGHVLPNALPRAEATGGDPCSAKLNGGNGSFATLARRFFAENLKGQETGLTGHGLYHLATVDAAKCLTVPSVAGTTAVPLGTVATTAAAGGPVSYELAKGPLTVAGIARIDATVTSLGYENKAFFALSRGTSPADAVVIQNNVMPLREEVPLLGTVRSIDLPGVAAEVPAGQSLFLTVSPVSDMSISNGSRTPGAFVLQNTVVRLPLVK